MKQIMLSEVKSKQFLSRYGLVFATEIEAFLVSDAVEAANRIGYPVAIKICADAISHKTERGLVKLNIRDSTEAKEAATMLLNEVRPEDGKASLLVAQMESGRRELIAGVIQDEQFGNFVMLGLGGVFAEVLSDTAFAPAPLDANSALDLINRIKNQAFLDEFRGERAVDREQLAKFLVSLSQAQSENQDVKSIDVNPIIVRSNGSVVAVDALVEMHDSKTINASSTQAVPSSKNTARHSIEHYEALFAPRGVVVVGASTHPGKFGFVSLHNMLTNGCLG